MVAGEGRDIVFSAVDTDKVPMVINNPSSMILEATLIKLFIHIHGSGETLTLREDTGAGRCSAVDP